MAQSAELPTTPSFRLDGKQALITGASSGIGLGCAVALAQAGAEITVAARRQEQLDALVQQLTEAGLSAKALVLDVTDLDAVAKAVAAQAKTPKGPFQVLLNSAGLARHTPAIETREADFDDVMDLNVKSAYFQSIEVARHLIEAGLPGSIINVSSQMAFVGGIDRAVYCATKHAVEGFTKSMAIEWGPHKIRINTLCPTFVNTELAKQTFSRPERLKWVLEQIKLGRIAEVEDLMGGAVFLASDASAMMTGTALKIDGGWTAA